jgi:hypothetical protein
VLAAVQDATRRCAAALRAVPDRGCAPARAGSYRSNGAHWTQASAESRRFSRKPSLYKTRGAPDGDELAYDTDLLAPANGAEPDPELEAELAGFAALLNEQPADAADAIELEEFR